MKLLLLCLVVAVALQGQRTVGAEETAAPPQAGVDWRFGVIESYENPAEAANLGVAWTRVRFQWATAQAGGPGTWTPSVSDAKINGEIAAGRTVAGLLIGIPDWARDGNGLPSGLWLPPTDPNNTWANFVREAVGRYSGRINHWIIWNEPDIRDRNAPGHTWDGSVEDLVQLQRVAYLVAKETNPNAIVHLPAFTYHHQGSPEYIHRFFELLAADPSAPDHDYYFDVATAHLYFQPNQIYDIIQFFYGAMGGRGLPWKPVWLVETNAPPINDPTWPVANWTLSVTLDEQAAYVPQALASALAAGAQRIAVYKMQDTADDRAANPEPFGLLRQDGRRRPAFTTYQVAIRYLAGMVGVARERWDEVGQIRVEQQGKTTTVLFARLPAGQVARVEAVAETAVLADMWGNRQTINAKDGGFTVNLPGALCTQPIGDYCMIGGATYYLVQATDGSGLPTVVAGAGSAADGGPGEATADPDTPTAILTTPPTPSSTPWPTRTPQLPATVTATATATASIVATVTATPPQPLTPMITPTAPLPATSTAAPIRSPQPAISAYWFVGAGLLLALVLVWSWWRRA